jgi:hypothetical protein
MVQLMLVSDTVHGALPTFVTFAMTVLWPAADRGLPAIAFIDASHWGGGFTVSKRFRFRGANGVDHGDGNRAW